MMGEPRWKRPLDVLGATLLLLGTLPVVLPAALAIRVSMGAPVLFRQQRMGRGGAAFTLWKLRSMREGAGGDAERLTRLGRFLRASSIDELPSLVQVLTGQMSLVGPRPLPLAYLDRFTTRERRRLAVRPGMTGLAQVRGRNALPWRRRLACDVLYAERLRAGRASLRLDLGILLATLPVVLLARGVRSPGEATGAAFRVTRAG